jgi:hypothetical protein
LAVWLASWIRLSSGWLVVFWLASSSGWLVVFWLPFVRWIFKNPADHDPQIHKPEFFWFQMKPEEIQRFSMIQKISTPKFTSQRSVGLKNSCRVLLVSNETRRSQASKFGPRDLRARALRKMFFEKWTRITRDP